MIDKVTRFLEI